jgi:hypothetical protein
MKSIKNRFASWILALLMITFSAFHFPETENTGIIFPRGVMVNVGQVGWMTGSSDGDEGGPWRAGIRRNFEVRDYEPIVEAGKELGIRFMTLFIMGEFDRLNILSEYPTSNPDGENWDNSSNTGIEQIRIMDYVKKNAANMEFGVTGVLHEYWDDGIRTRAEWFNVEEQKPREEKIIRKNIELLRRLMAQYNLTPENGHSFFESFIAYGFYFNPGAEYSLGRVLSDNGVKYANTPYATMRGLNHPPFFDGDFDHGVLLLDRFNHGNLWYEYAKPPPVSPDEIRTVVVESHWANWLAYDDHLQPELNERWLKFLRSIQAHPDNYLAKNTEQLYSQWLYKKYAQVKEESAGTVIIDNRSMNDAAYQYDLLGNMVLAVKLDQGQHVSHAKLDGQPIASYYEAEGYGYIYLPPLEKKIYRFEYMVGRQPMDRYVNNTGTYNVYGISDKGRTLEIELKMYGEQILKIRSPEPRSVTSNDKGLRIKNFSYDKNNSVTSVTIEGNDIQGEKGTVIIGF